MNFVSLEDFHRRKLRPGEAISLYVHDLKNCLYTYTILDMEQAAKEPLLLHHFLVGIPERGWGETWNRDQDGDIGCKTGMGTRTLIGYKSGLGLARTRHSSVDIPDHKLAIRIIATCRFIGYVYACAYFQFKMLA